MDHPESADAQNSALALKVPSLVKVANAQDDIPSIASEAGISAYFQANAPLNLERVKNLYRILEDETPNYLIGSVPVANYGESEDVHLYAHTNGFIMAYYFKDDPVAKIIDWRAYDTAGNTIPTKLESVLAAVAGAANVPFEANNLSYYDFRYPEATDLMLVADYGEENNDSFEITLPGTFVYYERSVYYTESYGPVCNNTCYLNDNEILYTTTYGKWNNHYFSLKESQLLPDTANVFRAVNSGSYTGVAIVYKKQ